MTTLPLAGISLWPIGTQAVLYLGSLLALVLLLRGEVREEDPARVTAAQVRIAGLGFLALGLPVAVWFLGRQALPPTPVLRGLIVLVAVGSLILAGLYALHFVETCRRQRILDFNRTSILRTAAVVCAMLSLAALAWSAALPSPLSVLVALGIVAVSAILVVVVWRQPKPRPPDALAWARLQSSMSRSVGAGLGMGLAMIIPLMALISIGLTGLTILWPFPPVLSGAVTDGQLVPPSYTLVELVQNAYLAQASALLISFLVAAVILGLLMLVISGRMALGRRRWPHLGD
jgi:hypothetical protein